jgi:RNA polymerase sigma factor (sigma-70 family)
MTERDDITLLREFAATESESAFAALVERHVNLVYSTALRSVGGNHAAEEIVQAVFIVLAQKAGKLSPRIVLSGWLYQTTRLTAANFLRGEIRRQKREQEAYMQSILNETDASAWPQIAPLLDDALAKLGEADRNAIVLRFFENKSLAEVGTALGASEDAAKMRVNRALEKLRKIFGKRSVTLSATLIAGAAAANSVQAAPAGLAATISTVALTKGAAAGGSTLALVNGALKIMAWTKMKTAIVVGAAVILAAATGTVAIKAFKDNQASSKLETHIFKVGPSFAVNLRNATHAAANASTTQMAGDYFNTKGLNFPPPKSIFFDDKLALLLVKATPSDLNAVERLVQQLDFTKPQIHMKAYFIEVPESDVQAVLNAGTVLTTTDQNSVKILDDDTKSHLLRLLRLHKATTLAAPEVTTLPGRQASLRTGDVNVDLISTLFDDGFTLKTKIIASTTETLTAEANIWDGQTIALGSQKTDGKSRLFVFTTTDLIDAAGNKMHSKADLPFRPGTIPPQ